MMTPRRILHVNALMTAVSAIALLAARGILFPLFGLDSPLLIDVVAVGFLVYVGALVLAARREPVAPQALMGFAIADGLWVAASAVVLLLYWSEMAPIGRLLVTVVAIVVEAFAILQYRAAGTARGRAPKMA